MSILLAYAVAPDRQLLEPVPLVLKYLGITCGIYALLLNSRLITKESSSGLPVVRISEEALPAAGVLAVVFEAGCLLMRLSQKKNL